MIKMNDISLSKKLPLLIAIPVLVIVISSGILGLYETSVAIEKDHEKNYKSFIHEHSALLESWLLDIEHDVEALAESYAIKSSLKEFSAAWNAGGGNVSDELRKNYIYENPNPVGQKDELDKADDGSKWSAAHEKYHAGLRKFQRAREYYDLFLFDLNGDLVYSVFKEDDFALNFSDGKYHNSGLGEAFKSALELEAGKFHMTEIDPYAPSAGLPAMFYSAPVFEAGERIGVVAIQVNLETMQFFLAESELLGESGLVYLVDANGRALNDDRHENGFKALEILPESEQIRMALAGESEFISAIEGINGHTVVATTDSVETPSGQKWGMVFEIDRSEANAFVSGAIRTGIIELLITAGLLVLVSWAAARGVVKRIGQLATDMQEVANHNFEHDIQGSEDKDEVGFLAKTLTELNENLKKGAKAQEREHHVQAENAEVVTKLSAAMLELANGDFRNQINDFFPEGHKQLRYSINDTMDRLSAVITEVRDTITGIRSGAEEISNSAEDLASRTESQAATLEQSAAALEEVTVSVKSSNTTVQNAESKVNSACEKAEESGEILHSTVEAMKEIEKSSQQINSIISVIDDIGFQTNLLALNAGVEAARAGEAGRGFAVVASEVRALAQRSSEAALEIKSLIGESGQQVGRGVDMVGKTGDALASIIKEVQEISSLMSEISKSSEEQTSALTEINTGIAYLDEVTQSNAAMVEENTAAAQLLSTDAKRLDSLVAHFKTHKSTDTPKLTAKEEMNDQEEPVEVAAEVIDHIEDDPTHGVQKVVANGGWVDF